jgi:adenosylhomocysteinase
MDIQELFNAYVRIFPNEASSLRLLAEQLGQSEDITSRNNFVGHMTASGFVVNEDNKKVLLLEHKTLAKLLQPGGHVISPDDTSLLNTALREIVEETGLTKAQISIHPLLSEPDDVPFDIDTHFIPENKKKGEPGHYHHDFRYLFTTRTDRIEIDTRESNEYRWIEWDDFVQMPQFVEIADKISSILEPSAREFFRTVAPENSRSISVIAVSHIIPSSIDYIRSLNDNFNLIGIVPKPRSIDPDAKRILNEENIPLLDGFSREKITKNPEALVKLLRPHDKVCLVDIGGYFSDVVDVLKEKLGKGFLGVVEDTENGHQKYEQSLSGKVNIISVARSPLKDFEDQLVGHSVAHAAETLLRQINSVITYRSCGVIGYGKVGRGIAEYLIQRGVRPYVCEKDPIRAVQAVCDGAIVCKLDALLRNSDVVFCATGMRAINILRFRDLKKGAFVASVTSSDDEFDLKFVNSEYKNERLTDHITRYSKRGHYFHLLNEGNAVNFLFAAAVDKFINLVQGELIASVGELVKLKTKGTKSIITNTHQAQENIAQQWLEFVDRSSR